MAGWPGVRRRSLQRPELGFASEKDAAMAGGGAEWKSAQPACSRDVQQLPRRALHSR